MLVRISSGTEIQLGLRSGSLDVKPSTAYLLTYHKGRCRANCAFCTQARESKANPNLLSRIFWPPYPLGKVIDRLKKLKKQEN
jgi:biotin synthase